MGRSCFTILIQNSTLPQQLLLWHLDSGAKDRASGASAAMAAPTSGAAATMAAPASGVTSVFVALASGAASAMAANTSGAADAGAVTVAVTLSRYYVDTI